ncbi:MAG: hypothetical protein WED34_13610 [Planctomycetales bacterium]
MLFQLLVSGFMWLGQCILLLNVARGRPARIGDLFAGGPYFLRMIGNSIPFVLALAGGLILLIVPGIFVLVMLWPYMYVLVDQNPPGIGALKRSIEITRGNWLHVFLLFLVNIGLGLIGFLMCCVGMLFTIPLGQLLFAVAYCRMVGHPTARR